jgi:hypothetical protein
MTKSFIQVASSQNLILGNNARASVAANGTLVSTIASEVDSDDNEDVEEDTYIVDETTEFEVRSHLPALCNIQCKVFCSPR